MEGSQKLPLLTRSLLPILGDTITAVAIGSAGDAWVVNNVVPLISMET